MEAPLRSLLSGVLGSSAGKKVSDFTPGPHGHLTVLVPAGPSLVLTLLPVASATPAEGDVL